jgi:hypothetical protein
VTSSPLELLRPKPFRGDVVAAGIVVLTTLVVSVALRFADAWPAETHLAYVTVAWGFVTMLALLAELEGEHPRAYQSILYVASIALFVTALIELTRAAGAQDDDVLGAETLTWIATTVMLFALAFAIGRNSAVCTLIGALAGGLATLAAVQWLWSPDSFVPFRWLLLALTCAYGLFAIGQRDRRLRHGVALIDAAGIAVIIIAFSLLDDSTIMIAGNRLRGATSVGWGWELLVLAVGFGLIAYSSVDRQPGPAYLGVLNLAGFAVVTAQDADSPNFLGWPLVLALAAAFLLVVGLRPTTPAPPPPDVDAPTPPPLPLR